jgi:hypothetical protein
MRNFILLSLATSIACSNKVPNDKGHAGKKADGPSSQSEADTDTDADADADAPDAPAEKEEPDSEESSEPGEPEPPSEPAEPIETDDDGDGWSLEAGDCDDTDSSIHPSAAEVCDGRDNDCDGAIDDGSAAPTQWYVDADGDGYGLEMTAELACEVPTSMYSGLAGDCDDSDAAIHPSAIEVCDFQDNDCDASIDEGVAPSTWYLDEDRDGYGLSVSAELACEAPSRSYVSIDGDCNDGSARAFPSAAEVCDEIDNDCDGRIDEDEAAPARWYSDEDGDGYGAEGSGELACEAPESSSVTLAGDCDDAADSVNPGVEEVCSTIDRDCDGSTGTEIATWFGDDGSEVDMTEAMSSFEGVVSLGTSGTLRICEGEWFTRIEVGGDDVTIKGLGEAGRVVLDGNGGGSTIVSKPSNERLVVRSLVVTGGDAVRGGGIKSDDGLVEIHESFIEDNEAELEGGGIYIASGELELFETEVSGNTLTARYEHSYGAGIRIEAGRADIESSTIFGNAGEGDVYGGGISAGEADLLLMVSVVEYNEASMAGGGIQVGAGNVYLTDSKVRFNEAGTYGGGLKVSGELSMVDSLVKGNEAEVNGGGAYMAMGDGGVTPQLNCDASPETSSGFRSNTTIDGLGGAVYSASSHFEIESDGCDWGADATENSPEDVRTRNWVGNANGDASFECNAARGCGDDDDMWTRRR